MRRMRGVQAEGDKEVGLTTLVLIYDEDSAFFRSGRGGKDIPLTKDEVRELAKAFRNCVDLWDAKKPGDHQ